MSAYTMYMKKMLNLSDGEFVARFGNEAGTVTEKFKALGTMWKSLDASEKKVYPRIKLLEI